MILLYGEVISSRLETNVLEQCLHWRNQPDWETPCLDLLDMGIKSANIFHGIDQSLAHAKLFTNLERIIKIQCILLRVR